MTRGGPASSATGSSIGAPWLEWFDDVELLRRHFGVAALGAWLHLLQGRPAAARRWRDAAASAATERPEPARENAREEIVAVLDAAMCSSGVAQMRVDAQRAVEGVARPSPWRPVAVLLRGVAELLGEDGGAEETLYEAAEAAEAAGATETRIPALAELALAAAARGDDARAEHLALEARSLIDQRREPCDASTALALAASARVHLRGDTRSRAPTWSAPRRSSHSSRMRFRGRGADEPRARACAPCARRPAAAQAALDRASAVLHRRPRLGTLAAEAAAVQRDVRRLGERRDPGQSGLTTAELRLLPLLTTHLSFREIAEQLSVSRNTVKTQAISVYRKLSVSSRSEAIAYARGLGLVEPASREEFTHSG